MPLPPEANVVEATTFDQLSRIIRVQIEDELHRRRGVPVALRLYINSTLASNARLPECGTALLAWAQAQGTHDVNIRLDETGRILQPPQCAFWIDWG